MSYFNSRPREGANDGQRVVIIRDQISIPAPARGRTYCPATNRHGWRISIPAPVRGRTSAAGQRPGCWPNFNSRPREGANRKLRCRFDATTISIPAPARGRTAWQRLLPLQVTISIPAPARGRTSRCCRAFPIGWDFNSRPREGANDFPNDKAAISIDFNSRPREGANRSSRPAICETEDFNSRPREGANSKTAQNRAVYLVSLLKFGRISAILPYILSSTRAKKRETPKIIGFLLRRPTGRSCMEQVGAGGVR